MERRLDTLQKIEIAEGVEIDLRPAGPFVRAAAYFLDSLIKIGVWIVLAIAIGFTSGVIGAVGGEDLASGITFGLMTLSAFLLEWVYSICFEVSSLRATPGKRAFKLQVAQLSGAPITIHQAVIRNMLRTIDLLPVAGGIGLISMLLTRRFQRLGDLAASTVVVYSGEVNSFRREPTHPLMAEGMRPSISLSREEQRAILMYAERAQDWTTPRLEELAEHAGSVVSSRTRQERVRNLFGIAQWIRTNQ